MTQGRRGVAQDVLGPSIRKVAVVGLGKVTGEAVVDALLDLGVEVRVTELTESEANLQTAARLAPRGVAVEFGEPDVDLVGWADLIIPSPGVPPANAALKGARQSGTPVWSEVELGWRSCRNPLVAITGTNGKTTTTQLLTDLLNELGRPAVSAGNIGRPLVSVARSAPPNQTLICEVSSFQLEFTHSFRPDIAVILNIAEDHFDWHSDREQYVRSKAKITRRQSPSDLLVVRADDADSLLIAADSDASLAAFSLGDPAEASSRFEQAVGRLPVRFAGVVEDSLALVEEGASPRMVKVGDVADIRLEGGHNLDNIQAALLAAVHLGLDPIQLGKAASSFEGMAHRCTEVAVINDVRYIDDSKATNPHATLSALKGFDNVVLIAGGRAKGLPLDELGTMRGRLKGVVAMGEAAQELQRIFSDFRLETVPDVEHAVAAAFEMAEPGDTVLLSPACSSLDQYANYQERGDRFRKAVENIG